MDKFEENIKDVLERSNNLIKNKQKLFVVTDRFTPEYCKEKKDYIIIYGDNCEGYGTGGQACIRYCDNAIGISTKKKPCMEDECFFADNEFEENCKIIDQDLQKVIATGKDVIMSSGGLGTGLSQLPQRCPRTYKYLQDRLEELFDRQG